MIEAYLRLLARWRWSLLLVLLILAMMLQPVWTETALSQLISYALFSCIFGGAVYAAHARIRPAQGAMALLALGLVLQIVEAFGIEGIAPLQTGVTFAIMLGALVVTFAELIRGQEMSLDTLIGAVFGYFVIAAVWALWFFQIERWQPGAFNLTESGDIDTQLLYFSLVTVTTVGYGDVTPLSAAARLSAGFEAMVGTLYMAIMIGRIVGQFKFPHQKK